MSVDRMYLTSSRFFRSLFVVAATSIGVASASADTMNGRDAPFHSALTAALGGERAALGGFSATNDFARTIGLRIDTQQPEADAAYESAFDAIAVQNDVDAEAAEDALGKLEAVAGQAIVEARTAAPARARMPEQPKSLSERMLRSIEIGSRDKQWFCLAEALYFEARGESLKGQVAVAEVILNRVDSRRYPNSICGVIRQGEVKRNACQFSYRCDGRSDAIRNTKVFERLGKVARAMINGHARRLTDQALFYHNTSVRPRWSRRMVRTAKIGSHVFYRPPLKLSRR